MKYAIIIEKGETSYGAYVPDLPGCVAVGQTKSEVLKLIREAIVSHLQDIKDDDSSVPPPRSFIEYVEI